MKQVVQRTTLQPNMHRERNRVDEVGYEPPPWLRAMVVAGFMAAGAGVAWAAEASLGDATWSVSTGIGACLAAAVYEARLPAAAALPNCSSVRPQKLLRSRLKRDFVDAAAPSHASVKPCLSQAAPNDSLLPPALYGEMAAWLCLHSYGVMFSEMLMMSTAAWYAPSTVVLL